MNYSESEIEIAIEKAVKEINKRAEQSESYIRGYNDCFALAAQYEIKLRKDRSIAVNSEVSYSLPEEFLKAINCNTFDEVAEKFKFSPVYDRVPRKGDVIVEVRQGFISTLICDGNYWITTTETNNGVTQRRRVLPKEIRAVFHGRPDYI